MMFRYILNIDKDRINANDVTCDGFEKEDIRGTNSS